MPPPAGSAQPGSDQPPGAARASGGRNSKARANSPASQRGGVRGPALSSAIPFVYHRRGTVGAGSSARSKRRLLGWRQGAGEVSGDSEKPRRIADGRAPHVVRARPRRRAEPRVACGDGVRRWLARRVRSIASPAAVGWGRACTGARRYRRLISMDGWTTHLNREFVIGGPRGIVRSHAYWTALDGLPDLDVRRRLEVRSGGFGFGLGTSEQRCRNVFAADCSPTTTRCECWFPAGCRGQASARQAAGGGGTSTNVSAGRHHEGGGRDPNSTGGDFEPGRVTRAGGGAGVAKATRRAPTPKGWHLTFVCGTAGKSAATRFTGCRTKPGAGQYRNRPRVGESANGD